MGNVNMAMVTCLVMAISAHECLTSYGNQITSSSELNPFETFSDAEDNTGISGNNTTEAHSAWPAALGGLTAVFFVGLLVALAVRYRFLRWCLSRRNHALLEQEESQFSNGGSSEDEITVRGMRGRMIRTEGSDDEDEEEEDDDGFIEDNYIPTSARKKAEEEEHPLEEAEDSDDELLDPETI